MTWLDSPNANLAAILTLGLACLALLALLLYAAHELGQLHKELNRK